MTMRLGIDFGTSYTAAAVAVAGRVERIRFEGGQEQFRTAVYLPRTRANAADFHADEGELARRLQTAKREQTQMLRAMQARIAASGFGALPAALNDAALEAREREVLRREWLREEEAVFDIARALEQATFGDAAIEEYMEAPDGALVESPKSMLGYRLDARVKEHIQRIVTRILRYVRETAEAQLGIGINEALIGRPVVFKGSMGEASERQAETILRESARRAGFSHIDFEYEPMAAAHYHHGQLHRPEQTLIVDIGGGTTDVTDALLGDKLIGPQVHANYGEPVGGTDLDFFLNLYGLMPLFGRNRCELGAHRFSEAANVRNVIDQRNFRQGEFGERAGEFAERLHRLQLDGGTTYLNAQAERAKMTLSSEPLYLADLGRFEAGLFAEITQETLGRATAEVFPKIARVLTQALEQRITAPDRIFLTGGSSRSPFIQALVQSLAPNVPLQIGDASFSVVSGLALRAAQ